MPKFRVTQHFEGSIIRTIEAKDVDEAIKKMEAIGDITLNELLDSNWDEPEAELEKE